MNNLGWLAFAFLLGFVIGVSSTISPASELIKKYKQEIETLRKRECIYQEMRDKYGKD